MTTKQTFTVPVPAKNQSIHHWISDKIEVLIFWKDGQLVVVNSICPHMGAKLQYQSSKQLITCPWHGLCFDANSMLSNHKKFKAVYFR